MHPQGRLYLVGAWLLVQDRSTDVFGAGPDRAHQVILLAVGFYNPFCRTTSMSLRAAVNL